MSSILLSPTQHSLPHQPHTQTWRPLLFHAATPVLPLLRRSSVVGLIWLVIILSRSVFLSLFFCIFGAHWFSFCPSVDLCTQTYRCVLMHKEYKKPLICRFFQHPRLPRSCCCDLRFCVALRVWVRLEARNCILATDCLRLHGLALSSLCNYQLEWILGYILT